MTSRTRSVRRVGSALTLMAGMALAMATTASADVTGVQIDDATPVQGITLKAVLEGEPVPERPLTFQWHRCADETPDLCVPNGGEQDTYVVTRDDAGHHLGVRVIQANPGGEQSETFWDVTAAVRVPPIVTNPTIGGQAIVGQTLTAQASATGFPDPDAVSYEWRRCAGVGSLPDECPSVGAVQAYSVVGPDAGRILIVRATAENSAGAGASGWVSTAPVQERPQVTSVTIAGQAVVGEKLTANATATGTPAPGLRYEWLHCAALLPPACEPIEDATAKAYVVASADAGDRLAVRVIAANSAGDDTGMSAPTDVVPKPVRFNQSGTTPTSSTNAPSSPSSTNSPPSTSTGLRYLRPFPVVRVKGFLVPGGARFSLVQIKAPRRSKVTVRCRKYACPVSRRPLRVGRIRALERFLPAGARITIRVRKPGMIGKYVRVVIRDGSPPKRRDACLLPGKTRPAACPPA
jgi:hypothetical protein